MSIEERRPLLNEINDQTLNQNSLASFKSSGDSIFLEHLDSYSSTTQATAGTYFKEVQDAPPPTSTPKQHKASILTRLQMFVEKKTGDTISSHMRHIPKLLLPVRFVSGLVDVTGISSIVLSSFARISALYFAVKDYSLQHRWMKRLDAESSVSPEKKKEISLEFDNLLKVTAHRSDSIEEIKEILKDHGIELPEKIVNKEIYQKAIENEKIRKPLLKQYTVNQLIGEKIELREQARTAQLTNRVMGLIEEHGINLESLRIELTKLGLPENILNDCHSKEEVIEAASNPESRLQRSINELVAKEHQTIEDVFRAEQSLKTTAKKVHSFHHKFVLYNLLKEAADLSVTIPLGVVKSAVKIASLAGGVSSPAALAVTIPLSFIPIAFRGVSGGIRFAVVSIYRRETRLEQLKMTPLKKTYQNVKVKYHKAAGYISRKRLKYYSKKIDKIASKPASSSKNIEKNQAKTEKAGRKTDLFRRKVESHRRGAAKAAGRVQELKERMIEAGWSDAKKYIGLKGEGSENYAEDLGQTFYDSYTEGLLPDSLKYFLKQGMGVDIDAVVEKNGERSPEVISRQIKKILGKDDEDMLAFMRLQRNASKREAKGG